MVNVPLPAVEGFQPIPNAVMIPFMEAQSAALAYGFGLNYEYGKRKIRSMSNTEFNSLTSEDITNMSNNHTHIILSKFQAQVPKVMPMQKEIFNQYVIIEKAKVVQNIELAKWLVDYIATGANTGIEQFFGNLFGTPTSKQAPLPPSTLPPERPTSIAQVTPTVTPSAQQKGGSFNPLVLTSSSPDISPKYNLTDKIYVTIKTYDGKNKTGLISWHRDMVLVWRNLALKQGTPSSVKVYLENTRIWSTIVKNLTGTWY